MKNDITLWDDMLNVIDDWRCQLSQTEKLIEMIIDGLRNRQSDDDIRDLIIRLSNYPVLINAYGERFFEQLIEDYSH